MITTAKPGLRRRVEKFSNVPMDEVMTDLETLGTTPNSLIAAIGAVKFDRVHGLGETFYAVIDVADAQNRFGFDIQASTFLWWLQRSEAARNALCIENPLLIEEALEQFSKFCKGSSEKTLTMWGNGSDFDCVLLSNAYEKVGIEKPWSFRNNRCYRTMKAMMPPVEVGKNAGAHNALDDAIYQAKHLVALLRRTPL